MAYPKVVQALDEELQAIDQQMRELAAERKRLERLRQQLLDSPAKRRRSSAAPSPGRGRRRNHSEGTAVDAVEQALAQAGEASQAQLSEAIGVSRTAVLFALRELAGRGLAERTDRRIDRSVVWRYVGSQKKQAKQDEAAPSADGSARWQEARQDA